jgi:hypothetical protein
VTNFFRSDRALKPGGSIDGVHRLSQRMAKNFSHGSDAGLIGGEGRNGCRSDAGLPNRQQR